MSVSLVGEAMLVTRARVAIRKKDLSYDPGCRLPSGVDAQESVLLAEPHLPKALDELEKKKGDRPVSAQQQRGMKTSRADRCCTPFCRHSILLCAASSEL